VRNLIKIVLITVFTAIISWQVFSIAAYVPFDYSPFLKYAQQTELFLADAGRNDVNLSLRVNRGKLKAEDSELISKLIDEYGELQNNGKYKQQAMEEIAALRYWAKDYNAALDEAKNVLAEYPNSLAASEVLAMCHHVKAGELVDKKNYDDAILEYEKIFNSPVTQNIKAFSKFYIAKLYEEKKKDDGNALNCYQEVADEYPFSEWGKRAVEKIKEKKATLN
jgi:hypothetical protein